MLAEANLQPLHTFVSVVFFVLGTMIGSFLNVCIYRLPRNESIVRPRSRCPKCESGIAWYDNVPIVSWLLLGAKCRHCGQPISWMYPLVEAVAGVLFLLVFWRFGFTLAAPIYMVLAAGLVLVTFVDLTDWTIPDEVTLPGIPLGLAVGVLGMFCPNCGLVVRDVFDSLLGVALGGGSLYLLDKVCLLLLGKRGMGFGDVKLLAMLGAFLGWKSVLLIIMIASCLGSVVGIALL
ncbi:MAG TPA: prepilin peptidase, partial [Candidatus Hydrogenedentes bacterium]|nr:prepilin peptidase [Candidatus Hydrogenedentota bacterium]